jgi:lysozyme
MTNISKEGLALIKKFEGCELKAYRCPANVLTIGYGVTKGVAEDMEITQQEADEMLNEEIPEYEEYINNMVKVPLEQCQFDALCAWVYNLGPTNLEKSTLLKLLNAGDYHLIPSQIKRWNKAGGETLTGLIRRREAESILFEGKEWSEV